MALYECGVVVYVWFALNYYVFAENPRKTIADDYLCVEFPMWVSTTRKIAVCGSAAADALQVFTG